MPWGRAGRGAGLPCTATSSSGPGELPAAEGERAYWCGVKGSESQKPQATVIVKSPPAQGALCRPLNKDRFVPESCVGDRAEIVPCPGWVGDDSAQGEEDGAQASTAMTWGCHKVPNTQP